ncbi:ABC transporter substrate-binding protein [uncultured Fusobacterium sp.]|uniref:ABC transporter substrate-binding protein n=1 Tax=uncultured Fusobacterium sp. TaxID=159267 RepID=UPI0034589EE7
MSFLKCSVKREFLKIVPSISKKAAIIIIPSFKIIDIIIENVSLAQTARNEYTSFIAKSPKGVEGLLENLRTKIKQ